MLRHPPLLLLLASSQTLSLLHTPDPQWGASGPPLVLSSSSSSRWAGPLQKKGNSPKNVGILDIDSCRMLSLRAKIMSPCQHVTMVLTSPCQNVTMPKCHHVTMQLTSFNPGSWNLWTPALSNPACLSQRLLQPNLSDPRAFVTKNLWAKGSFNPTSLTQGPL